MEEDKEQKIEIIIPVTRVCTKCLIEKQLNHNNFYRQLSNKYGYKLQCRACSKISDREIYEENHQSYKNRAIKWNKNNKKKVKAAQKKYRENIKKEVKEIL